MIGRRVVAQWRASFGEVAVYDNLRSGLQMPAQASLTVEADLCDEEQLKAVLREFRPHAILHLAAIHHIPTCEKQRAHCLEVNVVDTERLLAAAAEFDIPRLALASSGAVYAWQEAPLNEQHSPLAPCDNYALSKFCNEQQLRFWANQGRRIGRAARIFNAIGHDDPNAHLIPDLLAQLQQSHEGVVRLGNLAPRRDYLHADDIAAGLIALLNDPRDDLAFDALNFCSGVEHSVEQLVRELASVLERPVTIEVDPARQRPVDRISQLGDPSYTRRVLGWQPRMSFRQALQQVAFPGAQA